MTTPHIDSLLVELEDLLRDEVSDFHKLANLSRQEQQVLAWGEVSTLVTISRGLEDVSAKIRTREERKSAIRGLLEQCVTVPL